MSAILEEGEQGNIDWLMARVGHATGSRFGAIMDRLKSGKPGADRQKYLWELVIERLTGHPTERYVTAAMQHGIDTEPLARMAYESQTGRVCRRLSGRTDRRGRHYRGQVPDERDAFANDAHGGMRASGADSGLSLDH